jgi:hypothetical protein
MSASPVPKMTVAEYLEMDRAAPYNSEFVNGEVFAMPGGLPAHGRLALPFEVRPQIADDTYLYPDVMVVREGFGPASRQRDATANSPAAVEKEGMRSGPSGRCEGIRGLDLSGGGGAPGAVRVEPLGVRLGLGRIYRKGAGL